MLDQSEQLRPPPVCAMGTMKACRLLCPARSSVGPMASNNQGQEVRKYTNMASTIRQA